MELLSCSFNQDYGCFVSGTSTGFAIFNCEPFREEVSICPCSTIAKSFRMQGLKGADRDFTAA